MAIAWGRRLAARRFTAGAGLRRLSARAFAWIALRLEAEAERGRLFLWSPVALAAGVLVYFSLPHEPNATALGALTAVPAAGAVLLRRSALASMGLCAVALVAAGLFLAKLRTEAVSAPVLWKRHGPAAFEGVIREVERRETGVRLIIDARSIAGLAAAERPARIRVSWRGADEVPRAGSRIVGRAILSPPPGPVAPGAYHFGRALFFRGIGATGFIIGRPGVSEDDENGFAIGHAVARLRGAVAARIMTALPGEKGAIAAALLSGERGEISKEANAALRASGLAHILSISGMHMSMFAGILYVVVRYALAAVPGLATRRPIRSWAAFAGLLAAGFYLLLSGGGTPAERSCIMISIMFLALIAGRRALTMRNVALAALVIIAIQPESVLSASFQMSFGATIAIIAAYESAIGRFLISHPKGVWFLPLRFTIALAATSLIAGAATGIFAAFHFHTITIYGLFGNLAATPALGLVVMPAGMLALALMPAGLEAWPLFLMSLGLDVVMWTARAVASWSNALAPTLGLTSWALSIATFAGLWLCLWWTRWRLIGLALLCAVVVGGAPPRADVFIEGDGRTLAGRTETGRLVVAGLRSGRFAVARWLEADADPRDLSDRTLTEGVLCDKQACRIRFLDGRVIVLALDREALDETCEKAWILVTRWVAPRTCGAGLVIDGLALARGGSHVIAIREGKASVRTALEPSRPWDRWALKAVAEARESLTKSKGRAKRDR